MVDLTDFFAGKRYENFTDILPLGSEVTLFGAAPAMSADDLAEICGTIGYEITCAVSKRVPRVTVNE